MAGQALVVPIFNPLLHNNAFWRISIVMYLKIFWKKGAFALLEQMLHFQ